MAELIVTTRDGAEHRVDGTLGTSVMEIIRGRGFDELLAMCGGCCSCATCHVYVAAEDWNRLCPIGPDEDELLESSDHRTAYSRLSCHVAFDDALDGLHVIIAPED